MKAIMKHILILAVIAAYLFGTAGFTLSHCCCSNTFKTTSSIINAYTHSSQKAYANHTDEVADVDGVQSLKQRKCCGDSVYSMDGVNYNNEDNMHSPVLYLVELLSLPPLPDSFFKLETSIDTNIICDIYHFRLRKGCAPDILCTYLC